MAIHFGAVRALPNCVIVADTGIGMERVLGKAVVTGKGQLLVATPFFDPDAGVWQLLWQSLSAGVAVVLVTRWPEELRKQTELRNLAKSGVAIKILPTLHAKAVLFVCGKGTTGWIGSMNLTIASESRTAELGVLFTGDGAAESLLVRDLLAAMHRWTKSAVRGAIAA